MQVKPYQWVLVGVGMFLILGVVYWGIFNSESFIPIFALIFGLFLGALESRKIRLEKKERKK